MLLLPPLALIAVAGIALFGQTTGREGPRPGGSGAPDGSGGPAVAVIEPVVESIVPSVPPLRGTVATVPGPRTVPAGRRREEGTDGLMGRLPFGLANDTPLVPIVPLVGPSTGDSPPPWIRRLTVLGNYRTDPYQR
jgi:hypothetical protein